MRNEKSWEKRILPILIKQFTPRMQEVINNINFNDKLEKEENLYIHGKLKTGKTIYAAFLLLEFEKKVYLEDLNKQSLFILTSELLNQIRNSFHNENIIGQDGIIEKYKKISFLVLDDFGAFRPTDWVLEILFLLINYRYEYQLPTIFTSNNTLDETSTIFGDNRITSRIERMCKIVKKKPFKILK